ncbi:hypothetical protein E5288_WYG001647 [Bos mutus]|uniref:Uncharacterized protein n=1 Tax=Bos mutus TaxID=72004 RepID=A0A6B0SE84_9CETA|nr:hypothetical protein [Bos mutus]
MKTLLNYIEKSSNSISSTVLATVTFSTLKILKQWKRNDVLETKEKLVKKRDEDCRVKMKWNSALQEFYAEQKQHHSDIRGDDKYNMRITEENWQLSQFWYSPETALRLAEIAVS